MHGQLTCFLELLRSNAKRDITSFDLIDSPSLLPLFSSLKLLFLSSCLFVSPSLFPLATTCSLLYSSLPFSFLVLLVTSCSFPLATPPFLLSSPCFLSFPCFSPSLLVSPLLSLFLLFFSYLLFCPNHSHHLLSTPYPCASGKKYWSAKKHEKESAVSSLLHHCTPYHILSLSATPPSSTSPITNPCLLLLLS